jgi:hypothetical protein
MVYMALVYAVYAFGTEKIRPFLIVKSPFPFAHFVPVQELVSGPWQLEGRQRRH